MSTHLPDDRQPPMSTSRSPPPRDTTSLKKRKAAAPPRYPIQKKRSTAKILVDIPPPLPKRSYDKTDEETDADVAAYNKAFLHQKSPSQSRYMMKKPKSGLSPLLSNHPKYRSVWNQTMTAKFLSKQVPSLSRTNKQVQKAGNKFSSSDNRKINRPPRS